MELNNRTKPTQADPVFHVSFDIRQLIAIVLDSYDSIYWSKSHQPLVVVTVGALPYGSSFM